MGSMNETSRKSLANAVEGAGYKASLGNPSAPAVQTISSQKER